MNSRIQTPRTILAVAIFMFVGAFASSTCALRTGSRILPSLSTKASATLRIVSADPMVAKVVSESLARTGVFARIYRGGDNAADHELIIDTAVVDPSDDYSRNAGFSALTLTTALRVSTSARAVFRFRMGRTGEPYSEVKYESRGRIGMWSVLPLYTGFIATSLGTWLNDDRLPDKLRRDCLARYEVHGIAAATMPVCRDYEEFLTDAYSKVRMDFWTTFTQSNGLLGAR